MALTTTSAFLEHLEKSRLLTAEQLAAVRQEAGKAANVKDLAVRLIKKGSLSKWQASMLLNGRHNLRLGKYTLIEQIGSGELGHVFLAEHAQMERRVAVKLLSRKHAQNRDLLNRFLSEARNIAGLDHRNITHVYDVDSEGDRYYVVMEYVEGLDLQRAIDQDGPLPAETVAEYLQQAANGLAHAQENAILHGDLKPANLLVDPQGTIKILDIGVARLSRSSGESEKGAAPGTSHYVAPEQASEANEVDQRADIYSLGCIGYFLLTGKPPFSGGPESPPALQEICGKMMAKRPADRYQTAAEVSQALDKWLTAQRTATTEFAIDTGGGGHSETSSRSAETTPDGSPQSSGKQPAAPQPPSIPDFAIDVGSKKPETLDENVPQIAIATGAKPAARSSSPFSIAVGRKTKTKTPETPPAEPANKSADVAPQHEPAAATGETSESVPAGDDGTASAAGVTEQASAAAVQPKSKYFWLIIGGISATALLAIAAIILLVVVLLTRPERTAEVATSNGSANQPAAPAGSSTVPNTVEGSPLSGSPPSDEETILPATANIGVASEANVATSGSDVSAQPSPIQDEAVDSTAAASSDKSAGAAVQSSDASGDKPPQEKPDAAKPESNPDTKPESKPEAKTEPKPEPAKPAPPANPFRELAGSFSLPPLGTPAKPEEGWAESAALEPIHITPADEFFFIDLEGGTTAFKGTPRFVINPVEPGADNRSWDVQVLPDESAASGTTIGRFSVKDKKLMFQWSQQAPSENVSNYLRNCLLNLRTGVAQHQVRLREAIEQEPLTVDLDKGMEVAVRVEWPPDPTIIRVDLALENFPPSRFEPKQTLEAQKDATKILPGEGQTPVLYFDVTATMRRDAQINVVPMLSNPFDPRPIRFNKTKAGQIIGEMNNLLGRLNQQIQFIGDVNKIKEKRAQQLAQQQKILLEQEFSKVQQASTEFSKLEALYNELHNLGKIHYRVYFNAGTYQVELGRSIGFPQPQPATKG